MRIGKSKTLIKFDTSFVLMKEENQEESCNPFLNVFLVLHLYIFYIAFYDFASHFYILHKPTALIFKKDW